MKKGILYTVFLLSALLLSTAFKFPFAAPDTAIPQGDQAEIRFEYETHNFGNITQGDTVSFVFKCKNTGNRPLSITWVDTPCGCTSKDWTKKPIFPGAMGEVIVTYNSAGFLFSTAGGVVVWAFTNIIVENAIAVVKRTFFILF